LALGASIVILAKAGIQCTISWISAFAEMTGLGPEMTGAEQ
jgi:hypothetical protein